MKEEKSVIHDRDIREPLFDYLEETYGNVLIVMQQVFDTILFTLPTG